MEGQGTCTYRQGRSSLAQFTNWKQAEQVLKTGWQPHQLLQRLGQLDGGQPRHALLPPVGQEALRPGGGGGTHTWTRTLLHHMAALTNQLADAAVEVLSGASPAVSIACLSRKKCESGRAASERGR